MVKMFRVGFSRFDPVKGRFTAFLFNIANCCVIDALRRRTRLEARHVPLEAPSPDHFSFGDVLSDSSGSPAQTAESHGQMALVLVALDSLLEAKYFQAKTVELFKAATIEQKSAQEIAAACRTSIGNVYQAKHTVLAKLRSVLAALDEGLDLEEAILRGSVA
jgi:RNA polymerase sigma factor (sigma-70 family)